MLTRNQWLLVKLAEECAEVTQRVTKALTFGIAEVQAGQAKNNSERLLDELLDLTTIVRMLIDAGVLPEDVPNVHQRLTEREEKVEKWYHYAQEEGQVI